MIKRFKLVVLATAVGAVLTSAQATTYNGDLIVGFTTQSGNDFVYDLGAESSLVDGQTWDLSSHLSSSMLNNVNLNWGVIGNAGNTAWTTTDGTFLPGRISGAQALGALNTATKTIYQYMPSAGAGSFVTPAATDDTSWNIETLNGSLSTDYVNAYESPNIVGLTTNSFYSVVDNNTAPVLVGHFSLAVSGVVTFHMTATAPVAGFTGAPTTGFGPLQVAFTNTSTGSFTNSLWNFGDGHSITNSAASAAGNVTNTYAAGSYTVTLTVTGAGGASTNARTGYIVVSPAPTIGNTTILSGSGQLVFSGTNCPAGVQYRILTSTNVALPLTNWTAVATNTFLPNGSYSYTNVNSTGKSGAFFLLVSP